MNFKPYLCRSHPISVKQYYEVCGEGAVYEGPRCCKAEIEKDDNEEENDGDDGGNDDAGGDGGQGEDDDDRLRREEEFDSDAELDLVLCIEEIG